MKRENAPLRPRFATDVPLYFGDSDDVSLDFDGVDFNITGTGDINFSGFTSLNLGDNDKLTFGDDDDLQISWIPPLNRHLFAFGTGTSVVFQEGGGDALSIIGSVNAVATRHAWSLRAYDSDNSDYGQLSHTGANFQIATSTGNIQLTGGTTVEITGGGTFKINDSTNNDYLTISHSGSQVNFQNTGTTGDLVWTGIGGNFWIRDGAGLRVSDSGDTKYVTTTHDGTNITHAFTGTTLCMFSGLTGGVQIRDGAYLRIQDAGDTKYVEFSHDGTDFNLAATSTTDINITGGVNLKVFDSGGTHETLLSNDGTHGFVQASDSALDGMCVRGPGTGVIQTWGTSLSDDASDSFTLGSTGKGGILFITATTTTPTQDATHGIIFVNDTVITNIHVTNVSTGNGSNPDIDGDINVWSASAGTISVKNRRGGTRRIHIYALT